MTLGTIDLNADLGEGFGRWRLTDDEALLSVVTSANVACGFHAGDPATMRRVCERAAERGVRIGAQVSYRDLAGFGRRSMDVPADELAAEIAYQIGALEVFARAAGSRVGYVKPHGALYNRVVWDEEQAAAVVAGVRLAGAGTSRAAGDQGTADGGADHGDRSLSGRGGDGPSGLRDDGTGAPDGSGFRALPGQPTDTEPHGRAGLPDGTGSDPDAGAAIRARGLPVLGLPVLGLPGSRLLALAAEAGLPTVTEAFADRAYTAEGTLVPRTRPGAVVTDPAAVVARSVRMAGSGLVTADTGQDIVVAARSLCLHGDTPGAAELARRVRAGLAAAGIRIEAFV
jgi:lactam utilization protein B